MIQGKVWGQTEEIFRKNNVEIHRIFAKKDGFSSKHLHKSKHNMFFVESGKLMVEVWKNDYDLVDSTVISSGESTVARPGEYHRFTALEDTVALEIYWVELDESDIVRDGVGGVGKYHPAPRVAATHVEQGEL